MSKNIFINFAVTEEAEIKLSEKQAVLSAALVDDNEKYEDDDDDDYNRERYYDDDDDDDYDEDNGSYSRYRGGPTGELTDDFIDDVLGGEPDAYWNID